MTSLLINPLTPPLYILIHPPGVCATLPSCLLSVFLLLCIPEDLKQVDSSTFLLEFQSRIFFQYNTIHRYTTEYTGIQICHIKIPRQSIQIYRYTTPRYHRVYRYIGIQIYHRVYRYIDIQIYHRVYRYIGMPHPDTTSEYTDIQIYHTQIPQSIQIYRYTTPRYHRVYKNIDILHPDTSDYTDIQIYHTQIPQNIQINRYTTPRYHRVYKYIDIPHPDTTEYRDIQIYYIQMDIHIH